MLLGYRLDRLFNLCAGLLGMIFVGIFINDGYLVLGMVYYESAWVYQSMAIGQIILLPIFLTLMNFILLARKLNKQ